MQGLPDHALSFIESLYHHNTCDISFKGGRYDGFGMFCGVRQGCPLSPLLFAACIDVLLRMLQKRVPGGSFRAFADDIGSVLKSWDHDSSIVAKTFAEFASISGLELNIAKTVCIPLWEGGVEELEHTLRATSNEWSNLCIADCGTYLGFSVGPGRCGKSWDKPLQKYISRCRSWSNINGGLQYSAVAYNTFAASTLSFVAQLERPNDLVFAAQSRGLKFMMPGPKDWRSDQDAFYLKELYGQSQSFQTLEVTAKAAKLRILYTHDSYRRRERAQNIRSITCMNTSLAALRQRPEQATRACSWAAWYDSSFPAALVNNAVELNGIGISIELAVSEIVGHNDPNEPHIQKKVKRELQKTVSRHIKQHQKPDPVSRIRHKLTRWFDRDRGRPRDKSIGFKLAGPPNHIARRVSKHLQRLPTLVSPRVCAAVWRLVFNGWCTSRRFQGKGQCVLGCAGAQDSIEHYCCCPAVQDTLRLQLRVSIPSCRCLSFWMMNEPASDSDDFLMCSALITYAGYMATNHYRHAGITTYDVARDALRQHIIQATAGHPRSRSFLDHRWASPIHSLI